MAAHDMTLHGNQYMTYITYMTYVTYMTYITYVTYTTYITYITYITDSTYSTYMTYRTYMTYITDTLHFLRFQSMTRHDMTLLHILTYGSCAHGKGKGTEEKKKQSCTHLCCQRSLTPQAHALPSACRAESCLLCCQPEHPSVATYQIIMYYSMIALQTAS